MHKLRISTAIIASTLSISLLAACSSSAEDSAAENTASSTTASSTTDTATSDTRTVEHAMGTTELSEPIKTVVALDRGLLDPAIALCLDVVGFTEIAGSDGIPEYFGEDGKKCAADAVSVGSLSEPSIEQISSLKPDAILSAKVRHEEIYDQLDKVAPTIFTEKTGEPWKENLKLVGEAVEKKDEATSLIKEYEDRAQRIGDRVREKLGKNPTISVVRFLDEPTRLYKKDTYIGVVMSDLGFETNEAASGTGFNEEISEEQISLIDADHIFITTYADDEGISERTKEEFKRNPLWDRLEGEVSEVEDGIWMSAVGLYGANAVLDDIAETFGVDAD